MQENNSLDLRRLIELMLSNIKFIIVITLIFGIAAFCYTRFFITPQYSSRVTIYVNNTRNDDNLDRTYTGDIEASKKLVETYITIIKSNSVLNKVAEAGENAYSASQIRSMLSASAVANTEIFEVAITNPNPYHAAKIANLIAAVAPEEIANYVEASSVKVIDYAEVNLTPVSPNIQRNTALGVILGLILAVLIVLLKELFDVRVKSEEDLERLFQLPVLGVIPEILPGKSPELERGKNRKARENLDGKQSVKKRP